MTPYVSPCPVNVRRASMTDEEYWADVFPMHDYDIDPDDDLPDPVAVTLLDAPCPVCGTSGPCGYDTNGLPMIHVDESAT